MFLLFQWISLLEGPLDAIYSNIFTAILCEIHFDVT